MNSLLDVDQLRTFLAIVETGSFTRAAEIVHKTQSAVSMQMKRLEERLEHPIFVRDGRASKLTEEGERLRLDNEDLSPGHEFGRRCAGTAVTFATPKLEAATA